ncbi:MAG: hypothetical protein OHK0013_07930 [Sandaracinaceae bacterium]
MAAILSPNSAPKSRNAGVTIRRASKALEGRGYDTGIMRYTALVLSLALAACGGEREGARAPAQAVARPWPESVRLAVGARFSCAIDDAGAVWCWGDLPAESGALPLDQRIRAPHRIVGLERVHELATDDETLCARTAERAVRCWGPAVRDARGGPTELPELRGASAIAVAADRVCALVSQRVVCVGPNAPPLREAVPEGAWLAAVEDAVCVLDGRGAVRCAAPRDHALWEVSGSEGAIAIASGDGVCVVTQEGALRCDQEARTASEASLRPVEGVTTARWVAGTRTALCVAYDERIACTKSYPLAGLPPFEGEVPLAARALAVTTGGMSWHACALGEEGISCWGEEMAGEVSGRTNDSVALVAERPGARGLVLDLDALVVLDADGRLERMPLRGGELPSSATVGAEEALARPWLDLLRCGASFEGATLCGRQEGDRLAVLPARGRSRVIEGFAASGPPFVVAGAVCAPSRGDDVVCTDLSERTVVVPRLASPVSFEDRLCGLRAGRVTCLSVRQLLNSPPGGSARPQPEVLAGAPHRVERLHGGADQLFLWIAGGTAAVMGHNGAGQLGLTPSRPLVAAVPVPPMPFVDMAFARHASCGWAERGPLSCAGLDEALRPRTLAPLDPLPAALATLRVGGVPEAPEVERGDGRWVEIPGVRDVRALDMDGQRSCALEVNGAIRCWGGDGGGVGPRYVGPVVVSLAPPGSLSAS